MQPARRARPRAEPGSEGTFCRGAHGRLLPDEAPEGSHGRLDRGGGARRAGERRGAADAAPGLARRHPERPDRTVGLRDRDLRSRPGLPPPREPRAGNARRRCAAHSTPHCSRCAGCRACPRNRRCSDRDASHVSIAAHGLAVDAKGTVYAAASNRVFVIAGGRVTCVIGTGAQGFAGDGGPAADAQLNAPNGVAVDDAGERLRRRQRQQPDPEVSLPTGRSTRTPGPARSRPAPDGNPADRTAVAARRHPLGTTRHGACTSRRTRASFASGPTGSSTQSRGPESRRSASRSTPADSRPPRPVCSPGGIAISTDRSLWIADSCNKTIARVAPDGRIARRRETRSGSPPRPTAR